MTHFRELEEYEDDHLKAELKRREMSRTFRTCDYCHRETSTCDKSPCRFPRRAKRFPDKVEVVKGDFVIGKYIVTRRGRERWEVIDARDQIGQQGPG
jgi:hypothetical protein